MEPRIAFAWASVTRMNKLTSAGREDHDGTKRDRFHGRP